MASEGEVDLVDNRDGTFEDNTPRATLALGLALGLGLGLALKF